MAIKTVSFKFVDHEGYQSDEDFINGDSSGTYVPLADAELMMAEIKNAIDELDPEMSHQRIVELRERLIRFAN